MGNCAYLLNVDETCRFIDGKRRSIEEAKEDLRSFRVSAIRALVPEARQLSIFPCCSRGRNGHAVISITMNDGRTLRVPDVEYFFTSIAAMTQIPEEIRTHTADMAETAADPSCDVKALEFLGQPFGVSVEQMRVLGVLCGDIAWEMEHADQRLPNTVELPLG